MHQHYAEICGIERDGEELNCDSKVLRRSSKEFCRRGFLGSRVFGFDGWVDEGMIRAYIRNQEHKDERYNPMKLGV